MSRISTTIRKHYVIKGADGLSEMQRRVLTDPSKIRIVWAPTGSGKSYAFQHAVVTERKRVLFVVPTLRLAQNLAASIRYDLNENGSAAKRVNIWTSDERDRIRLETPDVNVSKLRVREMKGLDVEGLGDIVIATPESLAHFLVNPTYVEGVQANIVKVAQFFDHVVFDEFHGIEPRGFGLPACFATLISRSKARSKVTFLSATPIDIKKVLVSFGTDPSEIVEIGETVETGTREGSNIRYLHGDVRVEENEECDLANIFDERIEDVISCIAGGRQVVLVFDTLGALYAARKGIQSSMSRADIPLSKALLVSSVSDSFKGAFDDENAEGRFLNPEDYSVLMCTSSMEMGVNFNIGMMIMHPGHSAMSMVQRVGRAARSHLDGLVIVARSKPGTPAKDWLRMARRALDGVEECEVPTFVRAFTCDADASGSNEGPFAYFGTMPDRAAWNAALFWNALGFGRYGRLPKGLSDSLRAYAPLYARRLRCDLHGISKRRGPAEKWVNALVLEALVLRSIAASVVVCDPSGARRVVPWHIYANHPRLSRMIPSPDADGGRMVIHSDVPLLELLGSGYEKNDGRRVTERIDVLLPHNGDTRSIPRYGAREAWSALVGELASSTMNERHATILRLAKSIVARTGIIPLDKNVAVEAASSPRVVVI